jgi:hypothetical protein
VKTGANLGSVNEDELEIDKVDPNADNEKEI